jgi:hypothetical protein
MRGRCTRRLCNRVARQGRSSSTSPLCRMALTHPTEEWDADSRARACNAQTECAVGSVRGGRRVRGVAGLASRRSPALTVRSRQGVGASNPWTARGRYRTGPSHAKMQN